MNRLKNIFASGFFAVALVLALFAIAGGTRQSLPALWGTATTGYSLNASAVPVVTISGTNYTGVSTNKTVSNGAATNTLVFKNGILTSVE